MVKNRVAIRRPATNSNASTRGAFLMMVVNLAAITTQPVAIVNASCRARSCRHALHRYTRRVAGVDRQPDAGLIAASERIDNPAHHLELIAEAELLSIRYRQISEELWRHSRDDPEPAYDSEHEYPLSLQGRRGG